MAITDTKRSVDILLTHGADGSTERQIPEIYSGDFGDSLTRTSLCCSEKNVDVCSLHRLYSSRHRLKRTLTPVRVTRGTASGCLYPPNVAVALPRAQATSRCRGIGSLPRVGRRTAWAARGHTWPYSATSRPIGFTWCYLLRCSLARRWRDGDLAMDNCIRKRRIAPREAVRCMARTNPRSGARPKRDA